MNAISDRSRTLIGPMIELDRRAVEAFERRSPPELKALYADLDRRSDEARRLVGGGGEGTGCDVAAINLAIVVGFALNKLDGGGRYEDWMEEESLRLLDEYAGYLADCGADAGRAAASGLTADHVKAL